ncbi:CBS domain protein [Roseiarcus fermentans]|uniref:CBS domain protein n=1 Tax=Roseiarcus fermentans TaxID=1473586 RepID=A0A366FE74_9HYPH|nr:CBS domain-containing protein [Roseiarcus fermentans]RBP12025.1 CBS domain protein [Roseiarcus fermentans]
MTHTQSESALRLRASDLMTAPAIVAEETATIREVARLMLEKGVGAIPILNASGEAIGIVSDGDLLGQNEARRAWWLGMLAEGSGADAAFASHGDQPVRGVMSAPLVTIGPQASAQDIAEAMIAHRVKRLPVIDNGQVIGVVSRADLLKVVESLPKARLDEEPGAGFLSFLESLIGGSSLRGGLDRPTASHGDGAAIRMMQAPAAAPPAALAVSATDFRARVNSFKSETVDHKEREKKATELDRRRQVKALVDRHVDAQLWQDMLDHARLAASEGETEYLLLQFPSDLCTDGGRRIDVAEEGWEETLRGEAADVYDRWRKELKPQGFGFSARIVSYVDGVLGDIGLFLTWGGG